MRRLRPHSALLIVSTLAGCISERQPAITSGSLYILVAPSIAPPVEKQVEEFMRIYGPAGADLHLTTVASQEAVRLFVEDTFRVALVVDSLSESKRESLKESSGTFLSRTVAYDGVAVVSHPENPVGSLTTSEIRRILTGALVRWESVAEGSGASGAIRVFAVDGSDEISYLADRLGLPSISPAQVVFVDSPLQMLAKTGNTPGSVGFIGSSWLSASKDSVRMIRVKMTEEGEGSWYDVPSESKGIAFNAHPAHVYRGYYPFRRSIVLLSRSDRPDITAGFNAFVLNKDGQRFFLEAGIVPATQPIRIR